MNDCGMHRGNTNHVMGTTRTMCVNKLMGRVLVNLTSVGVATLTEA